MRVNINLASRPYEDARRFWMRWGGALFVLGVITLVLLFFTISGILQARRDRALLEGNRQKIAERDRERAQAEALLNMPQHRTTRDRSQFLNELFERKAFSWTRVFEDLEQIMPKQLHVVSIQPDMTPENELQIKMIVAGQERSRALELVRKMEESRRFHHTHIDQEQTHEKGQAGDSVEFEISAVYVPDLPGENLAQGGQ
jgi:type IV pilus assembly protein PilN